MTRLRALRQIVRDLGIRGGVIALVVAAAATSDRWLELRSAA